MEQQRLELQKTHSTEMEHVLGKVSDQLSFHTAQTKKLPFSFSYNVKIYDV